MENLETKKCNKLIRKLLLTVTIADPQRFTLKNKLVKYIEAFVEFYNWKNRRQVYKIYRIIKLEKICTLTVKNSHNLSIYWMIEILLLLYITHIVFRDQNKFVFYIKNYID